ncbi:ribose-phosphate diphosphokinase [Cytophagaceae bacterium ABcell3]|nr:ribose-phosphate diphosphokinase [Cytophagaceae bacterium ABcell3]
MEKKLIFATQNYLYMRDMVVSQGGFDKGEVEVKYFPDGERYQRVLTSADCRDVVLIGGTISDSDTLEFYDLACALVKHGARSLLMIIPYFGYSTMERNVKPGEVITAKTRARIISVIPLTGMGNKVIFLDLHTEGLPHYLEGNIRHIHIYGKSIILNAAREIGGDNFVMACTDAGRAKWVESLANDLGVNAAFVFKRRLSGEETEITSVSADVKGKTVVIYDDMIRTGGSLVNAAKAYMNAGAVRVAAITTHGLFTNNGMERIEKSGLFYKVICTDSHPNVLKINNPLLEVRSVAKLFADRVAEIEC